MAQLTDKPCPGDWSIGGEGWSDRHDRQFEQLQEEAAKVDPAVSLVGALISFPWADGAAYYRVSSDKPLKLQAVPYADAWQVPYTQIRGLRRVDAIEKVEQQQRLSKFFAERRRGNFTTAF